MNKIRCSLAAIALVATLSGLFLQGSGSLANAASIRNASAASAPFVAGKSTRSVAVRLGPYCPGSGTYDC
jgi:hypothetical protein